MGVHRTRGEPDEIKKNTHPKNITARFREQVEAVGMNLVLSPGLKGQTKGQTVVQGALILDGLDVRGAKQNTTMNGAVIAR